MQTRAAIDSLYSVFKAIGGEGGITRRSAPRPFGAALAGVIPASSLRPSADPYLQKFTYRLAERVGFEPTNTVRCYTLSRRAPSTARPPLHKPQSAPTAGRDCSRRTPLVLRFAPDRCSFAATSNPARRRVVEPTSCDLAERVRFELTRPVRVRRFSRPVHSTALPPLPRPKGAPDASRNFT